MWRCVWTNECVIWSSQSAYLWKTWLIYIEHTLCSCVGVNFRIIKMLASIIFTIESNFINNIVEIWRFAHYGKWQFAAVKFSKDFCKKMFCGLRFACFMRRSGEVVRSVRLRRLGSRVWIQLKACVVLLLIRKETLLRFPLSTQVYEWVPDPVQDWGRQRQWGRGDWHHPHCVGPEKSEMLLISLTYDPLVMVITIFFTMFHVSSQSHSK